MPVKAYSNGSFRPRQYCFLTMPIALDDNSIADLQSLVIGAALANLFFSFAVHHDIIHAMIHDIKIFHFLH
jgi:hypothetical protein